jgi:hypothetical protein
MKELLTVIVKNLVEEPDSVEVTEESKDNIVSLKLKVAADDMGKVIGKQGRIAKAIRTVLKAAATHEEKRVVVEIVQ